MKKLYGNIIFIILFFIVSSGLWAEEVSLITDQYWNSMLEAELSQNPLERIKKMVTDTIPFGSKPKIRIDGQSIKVQVVDTDGSFDFEQLKTASAEGGEFLILSPLFASYACDLGELYPEKVFIAPCAVIPSKCDSANLENVSFQVFDFYDAGFKAGSWAAEQDTDVYCLFYTGDDHYRKRIDAFIEGWSSIGNKDELNITEFYEASSVDSDFLDRFQTPVLENSGIAVVFAGYYNESVFNRFDGSSVRLISEFSGLWHEAAYNTEASLELDPVKILSDVVKSIKAENYTNNRTIKADFFLHDRE